MLKNPRNTCYLFKDQNISIFTEKMQKFRKFFVLDFEATCDQGSALHPMEIIEFPCLEVRSTDFGISSKFHRFVKPTINPVLTPFCSKLTGISQDAVNNEPEFPEVFHDFLEWLKPRFDVEDPNDGIFVTCGTWDLNRMLPEQCKLCNLDVPPEFDRYINIKTAYYHALGHYPRSIKDMMKYRELQIEGRIHRGLDDCLNIIKIMKHLAEKEYIFEETDCLNRQEVNDATDSKTQNIDP